MTDLRTTRLLMTALAGVTRRIVLSGMHAIAENASNGTTIGTLSVINGPSGSYTFTVNSDPDGLFGIAGGDLDKSGTLDFEAAASHRVQIKADNGAGSVLLQWFTISVTDVAPVLSNPTDIKTGRTTATITVDTTEGDGTLYWVVTTSALPPSAAQIKAGQDHSGFAAAASGTQAISSTGTKTASITGLASSTTYTAHFMHEEAAGLQSNVATGGGFTTDADPTWQTTWAIAPNTNNPGLQNYSFRIAISAAHISISGSTVRVTFDNTAGVSVSMGIANASIVERSSGTENGVRAPTTLLFGGLPGCTIAAGQSQVSDALSFSLDETKDYLVIIDMDGTNGSAPYRSSGGDGAYFKAATDSYNVQTVSGFSAVAGFTFMVSKIEVFA